MKKLVAVLVLLAYITFSLSAFADSYDDLLSLDELVYNEGSFSSDIELSSASEFEFLNAFEDTFAPYSLKSIVSGLANSKIHIDADYSTKRDEIFKAYFKITTHSPIKLNEELTINTDAIFHLWITMNFVDSKRPYYKFTLKTPMSEQYFVFCSSDENAILFYPAKNRTAHIRETLKNGLRDNADIVFEEDEYKVSVDDNGLKNILKHLTENAFNYLYLCTYGNSDDTENYDNKKRELPKLINRLRLVRLLGLDGITQKFTLDTNQKLRYSELEIDLNTNIFRLHYSITGDPIPSDPTAKKPIINATNSDVELKIGIKTTYNKTFTDFYYPRPVKRLITNVFEGSEYTMDYTTSKEVSSPYETISVISPGFATIVDGTPYIPLRNMLTSLGVNNKSISWVDGNIEIYEEIGSVLPFNRITMSENSSDVVCDGIPVTLSNPVLCIDHISYVPEDFVNKVLDATVLQYSTSYNHYENMYYTTTDIERLKPVYYIHLKDSSFNIIN